MNKYYITLLTLFLIISTNIQAKLVSYFDHRSAEQIETDNVFTDEANIYLSVFARLDAREDWPGLKLILGYDMWCTGDNVAAKNIAQQSFSDNELIGMKMTYDTVRPNLWNEWPSGSKTCTLTWTGGVHRTTTNSNISITSNISGIGSSIGFTYTSAQPTTADHNAKTEQKVFTMVKPRQIGGFCEAL